MFFVLFFLEKKRTKRKAPLKQNATSRFGTTANGWALGVFSRHYL